MGGGCQDCCLPGGAGAAGGAAGGLADGDGGDPVCAGGAAADDLWRAVAKRSRQAPADVLPLQYAVSLGLCLLIAPVSGFRFTVNAGLIIPVLFRLLISVVAQLLLYRLLSVEISSMSPASLSGASDHGAAGLSAAGQTAAGGGDDRYDGDRRRDRAGIPHREGPRRLMASRALRRPVHFPVIFLRMLPAAYFDQ